MWGNNRLSFMPVALIPVVASLWLLPVTETGSAFAAEAEASLGNQAAHVEAISGSDLSRITLTQKAADRLDIQTGEVRQGDSGKKTVPYTSVVYDTSGATWVYTNPQPLIYIRHSIVIELITGEEAVLQDGPAAGTLVVTTGVTELYGTEQGVGH